MLDRTWCNEYRITTVCIDSYLNGELKGRFYDPYCGEGVQFHSVTQFLMQMEQAMDEMGFPKAFTETRVFTSPAVLPTCSAEKRDYTGKRATFALRILFRQNSSWQGSVTWLEGKQERSFRSVLELIRLMDNALSYADAS